MKELQNLSLFVAICFLIYLVFRNVNHNPMLIEGMTDASGNTVDVSNGIAGNAASYAASVKSFTIKLQDTFLISKYRSDYESAILNVDDLINNLMLKATLSIDVDNPQSSLETLTKLQAAKSALNSVMKFVDSQ